MTDAVLSVPSAYLAARSGEALEYATQLIRRSLHAVVPPLASALVMDLGCGYNNLVFEEWLASA
jgi:SAM-dependent methyltransferase